MAFFQPDRLPSLMVAPNGARKVKKDHPEIPLTIKECSTRFPNTYVEFLY